MRLSVHKIKAFKACRRKYELRYIEHMEPVNKAESLIIGSNYHKYLERLYKGETLVDNPDLVEDYSKELAMARVYEEIIYPSFKVVEAEKWIEYDLGNGDRFVGVVDGIADDGHIVEHKTTGSEITEEYEYNLLWDEQILAYMLLTGYRKVWYTVCRKPTIRQKKDESDKDFFYRMIDWYNYDTENKIRLLEITRTDEEVEEFRLELLHMKTMMNQIHMERDFYRNTCHCNQYGRRCEYSSICLNYDPNQEYIDFVKGEEYEPEKDSN